MQNIAKNEFVLGLDTDNDNSRVPKGRYRMLRNARIKNVAGNDFVVEYVKGNTQQFSLTNGFKPFGYKTFKGITYIISFNEITNETEIGCYPSPASYGIQGAAATTTTGFNPVYKPLWNYIGNNNQYAPGAGSLRQDFKTTLFTNDKLKQLKVTIKQDYDKSVNIYFCDGLNSDKVINSGFNNETGAQLDKRFYSQNCFPCFVELINESTYHPVIKSVDVLNGGKVKFGNHKFYFRYSSDDFNPTSYLAETFSVMITDASSTDKVGTEGGNSGKHSSKSVQVILKNLDPAYNYIEVAYSYHFDETFETGSIDKRFKIDYLTNECTVLITGNETTIEEDLSTIITKKPLEKISEVMAGVDNRLFKGNVKQKYGHIPELIEFAKRIVPRHDVSKVLNCPKFDSSGSLSSDGMYGWWDNTYNYVGYFSGEAYAFGIIGVWDDGTETGVYPTQGIDGFNNYLGATNDYGMFRFPSPHTRHLNSVNATTHGRIYSAYTSCIMGVAFNESAAKTYLNSLPADNQLKKLVGYYYVRTDRKKNLLYQGLSCYTFNTKLFTDTSIAPNLSTFLNGNGFFNISSPDINTNNTEISAPFMRKLVGLVKTKPRIPYYETGNMQALFGILFGEEFKMYGATADEDITTNSDSPVSWAPNKLGVFSFDHWFKQSMPKNNYWIQPIANSIDIQSSNDTYHDVDLFLTTAASYVYLGYNVYNRKSTNVLPWVSTPINGFASYFKEGNMTGANNFFAMIRAKSTLTSSISPYRENSTLSSLEMAICQYIGISFDEVIAPIPLPSQNMDEFDNALVNLWIQDPNTIDVSKVFDIKNETYVKISPFQKISNLHAGYSSVFYNGDCFIQRGAIKILSNPDKYPIGRKKDNYNFSSLLGLIGVTRSKDTFPSFGHIIEFVSENELNIAVRQSFGAQSCYPQCGPKLVNAQDHANKNVLQESSVLNKGYSFTGSVIKYQGFNYDIPVYVKEYPTRIMGSNAHVINGYKDGWRNFGLSTYRDYSLEKGSITGLEECLGTLVSIQKYFVGVVPINERVSVGTSSGEIAVGFGELLPPKQQIIVDKIGSQHKFSIINTGNFIYGVDVNMRKIWRVNPQQGLELISDSSLIQSWLYNYLNSREIFSDSTNVINNLDSPVFLGEGISVGYDIKNSQVIFTFLDENGSETIAYNEEIKGFDAYYDFKSPFYITLNKDFYASDSNNFYWQDSNVLCANFFGVQYGFELKFIVNDYSDLEKVFDNYEIVGDGEAFTEAEYETLGQTSNHTPWTVGGLLTRWRDPLYKIDRWRVSINRASGVKPNPNNNYAVNSKMSGIWIEITLKYSGNKSKFIKSILTEFIQKIR